VLLDTHFLLWLLTGSPRLKKYPWLADRRPWSISPVSLLEIRFLHEIGRLTVDHEALASALAADPRFVIDDVSLSILIDAAMTVDWTRDPFDRLLAAHSQARRLEFCSADRAVQAHHRLVPAHLRPGRF
jgi:PIN domain nuclease of toxin-antitoxin system